MSGALFIAACIVAGGLVGWATRPLLARYDSSVPARVPVPEVLTGGLFGLAAAQYDDWRLLALFVLLAASVALTIVDLRQYRLPNDILFPAIAAAAAVIVLGELIDGDTALLTRAAVGAVVYCGILLVMHLVNPAGMGFGDVKLAILLGLFVGWVSDSRLGAVRAVMVALLIGSALGVALGVLRIAVARLGRSFLPDPLEGSAGDGWRRQTFPFGPPLMVGAILVALYPATLLPS